MNSHIINDALDLEDIEKNSALDRFKNFVLRKSMLGNNLLIDIGSASGRFLYKNKHLFKNYLGVEIAKESLEFSRKKLHLNVRKDLRIDEKYGKISVVTFWQTLEHIPAADISKIMQAIRRVSCNKTKVIISVPNSDSLMYRLFGKDGAFFDKESHYHQFSKRSLDLNMKQYGFVPERGFYSFTYTLFGYIQSLLNKFNGTHNFMYYYMKRRQNFSMSRNELLIKYLYNLSLSAIFTLPAILLSIYDIFSKDKRAIITICYKSCKT